MKKILLLTINAFISLTAAAQLETGGFYINASGDFSYSSVDVKIISSSLPDMEVGNQKNVNIAPQFGFFLYDNLVGGIGVQLENVRTTDENDNVFKTNSFLIGPFIRYYLDGDDFRPYIEATGGRGQTKSSFETSTFSDDDTDKLSGFNVTFGGAYFVRESVSIDFGILYERRTVDFSDDPGAPSGAKSSISGFGGKLGFSIYL